MTESMLFVFAILFCLNSATDQFYPDLDASSKSGRFRVKATSPDNEKKGHHPFQDDFTYRCIDTKTSRTIWTRQQPSSQEGSPTGISVSDSGATVVYTGYDNILLISPNGEVIRKIDFLKDALTKEENSRYVHQTTAGPKWTGLATWYFVDHAQKEFFVIRPWWGRRVTIDVESGTLEKPNGGIENACVMAERDLVKRTLNSKATSEEEHFEKRLAIYLAGVLKMKETIPLLREAEKSAVIDSSTSGGLSWNEEFENEVDPHSYSTFSIRQIAQLSLRRLAEKPSPLPCNRFEITKNNKSKPFIPELKNERHENVNKLKIGMSAKEILMLIGSPDFVSYDEWSYDMDSTSPFSLTIKMDARKSTGIKRQRPSWINGFERDEALAQ